MTKEELEKEAEEWIKDHSGLIGSYTFVKYDYDSMQKSYLAGTEPREKRIEELEESLGKLQKSTFHIINEKNNYIAALEKENANVKEALEGYKKIAKWCDKCELEKKISILLSCKNCPENKGGLICQKEYEDKCLAQKIQYIKELQEENERLTVSYETLKLHDEEEIGMLKSENAELKTDYEVLSCPVCGDYKGWCKHKEIKENEL